MGNIQKFDFDSDTLTLDKMTAGYTISDTCFTYYQSEREKGMTHYLVGSVQMGYDVRFPKKVTGSPCIIYHYLCDINCNSECPVLMNITLSAPCKVWVNNSLLLAQSGLWQTNVTFYLDKGMNRIEFDTDMAEIPCATIVLYKAEMEMKPYFSSRLYKSCMFRNKEVEMATNGDDYFYGGIKKLLITPLDRIHLSDVTYRLRIADTDGNTYKISEGKYAETYSLNTDVLPKLPDDKIIYYKMHILYPENEHFFFNRIILSDLRPQVMEVIRKAEQVIETQDGSEQILLRLEELLYEMELMDISEEWSDYVEAGLEVQKLLEICRKDKFKTECIENMLLYRSDLDGKPKHIKYRLPDTYDNHKRYPLLAYIALLNYDEWSQKFTEYNDNEIIIVDILGRGVNFGSYIGEAAILEQIEVVKKAFKIDEDKIYLSGFCAAAGSAWQMAQAYPHMFAGIISYVATQDFTMSKNLYNTDVIAFYHDKVAFGTRGGREALQYKEDLERYSTDVPKLVKVPVNDITHNDFLTLMAKGDIVNYIITKKRNPYPNDIYYTTRMHRHRKAFWLTIDNIKHGYREANIEAHIIDNSIEVRCSGMDGFIIDIPPVLRNKLNIELSINGIRKIFPINKLEGQYHISLQKNNWLLDDKREMEYEPKGSGLLDVYCNPLSIVYSGQDYTEEIALRLATPLGNGFNPTLIIDYPVDQLDDNFLIQDNRSYIIICNDMELENIYSNLFCNVIPIDFYKTLTLSRKKRRYCLWKRFDNPKNHKQGVVIICSNDWKYYKNNIIFRRFSLPTYLYGNRAILNNQELVILDRKYYGAYSKDEKYKRLRWKN